MALKNHLDKYGQWALVAGGAKGLGRAFCDSLLGVGKNVISIDSDTEALRMTCADLGSKYNNKIIGVEYDLSQSNAAEEVIRLVSKYNCRLLVYNAAYGPVRRFEQNSAEQLETHLNLNARTLLHLSSEWVKMQDPNVPAGFLAMSSMAGIRGTLLVAPYAATKAFIWNLMESLYYEFRDTELDFSAMCAGPVATENYIGTEPAKSILLPKPDSPEYVAEKALMQIGRRPVDVPGPGNRFSEFILSRLLPRSWSGTLNNRVMAKSYQKQWNKKK